MIFDSPWMLLSLLLIPVLLWLRRWRLGRRGAIRFSWTRNAARAGRSFRQRLSWVPVGLRVLALILLILAVARPQKGMEQIRNLNEGIAIEMVVDRSSSMSAEMIFEGARTNRLEAVKKVFERFVLGDGKKLEGRTNDLIGMISFARYADTICPLTLGHGALPQFLETVRLAQPRSAEDGTAIGDAVALAAARLKTAEETVMRQSPDREDKYEIKSKIMILLTDGQQTAGKRDPLEAAKLAADWDIKIYTIAVGGGEALGAQNTLFGRFLTRMGGQEADTRTLKAIAKETGGRFYLAEEAKSLAAIYRKIDELERSEIESIRFMDYREMFAPFALFAFLLVGLETGLSNTVFRKIP